MTVYGSVTTLCKSLGVGRQAYYDRLRRGWTPEQAANTPKGKHVIPRPRTYRKSRHIWPMTAEQREINRVLKAWKRS